MSTKVGSAKSQTEGKPIVLHTGRRRRPGRTARLLREIGAMVFWVFALIKAFVYDFDTALVAEYWPDGLGLLHYRAFVLLGLVAALWLVLGNRQFMHFVAYVAFYPIILFVWKVPSLLVKHWALAIAFAPAVRGLREGLRRRFLIASAAIFGALAIVASSEPLMVIGGMMLVGVYLLVHIAYRARSAFRPTTIFADLPALIQRLWKEMAEDTIAKSEKKVANLDHASFEYRRRRAESVLSAYTLASVLHWVSLKLRGVLTSRKLDIYLVIAFLRTAVTTVVVFAFLYFGLERMVPGSFQPGDGIGFWPLFGFSFDTIMTADHSGLRAVSGLAKLLAYSELMLGLLILVVGAFVVWTSARERHQEEMDGVIDALSSKMDLFGRLVETELQMTLIELERLLCIGNAQAVNALRKLRGLDAIEKLEDTPLGSRAARVDDAHTPSGPHDGADAANPGVALHPERSDETRETPGSKQDD